MTHTSTEQQPEALRNEPVAYLWQHTITGQKKALMRDDVFTAGPHWRLVGPLHLVTESVQAVPKQASTQPANL